MQVQEIFRRRDAVRVSVAYRYHNPNWTLMQNQAVYGADHSAVGMGANMTVELEVESEELDSSSKVLIPESEPHRFLAEIKGYLDHRCLFEVEPWFNGKVASLENVAIYIAERIWKRQLVRGRWGRLVLAENNSWKVQIQPGTLKMVLSHSFQRGIWRIQAGVEGVPDPESGLILPRTRFYDAIARCEAAKCDINNEWHVPVCFFRELKSQFPELSWLRAQDAKHRAYEQNMNCGILASDY